MTKICFNALIFKSNSSPRQPKIICHLYAWAANSVAAGKDWNDLCIKVKVVPCFPRRVVFLMMFFLSIGVVPAGGRWDTSVRLCRTWRGRWSSGSTSTETTPTPPKRRKFCSLLALKWRWSRSVQYVAAIKSKVEKSENPLRNVGIHWRRKQNFPIVVAVISLGLKSSILICVWIKIVTDMFLYPQVFILQLLRSAGYHYFNSLFNAALSMSAFNL